MDIIRKNPDLAWNWQWLFKNEFKKDKQIFYEEGFRKYLAAFKIQQWWKKILFSPYTKVGKRYINKKYDELFFE